MHFVVGAGSIGLSLGARLGAQFLSTSREGFFEVEILNSIAPTPEPRRYEFVKLAGFAAAKPDLNTATLWICTKAYHVEAVLKLLAPAVKPTTHLILCQNGLGLGDLARKILPQNTRISRLTAWYGSSVKTDDKIQVQEIGPPRAEVFSDQNAELLKTTLKNIGYAVKVQSSLENLEWRKALINTINILPALYDAKNKIIFDKQGLSETALKLLFEVFQIVEKEKIDIGDLTPESVLDSLHIVEENINSFTQDLRKGQPTEIAFLHEVFLEKARLLGLQTPVLDQLVAALRALIKIKI